jgi:hypothetical protein
MGLALQQAPQATEERIRTLYQDGHWQQAADLAAGIASPTANALFYRAMALARLKRLDEAARLFQTGIRQFPDDARFAIELAGIEYRNQNIADAKHYLHRALQLEPDDEYANDFLASLYLLDGNVPAAVKYWNRISKPLLQNVQFVPQPPLDFILRERTFPISGGQRLTTDRLLRTQSNLDRLDVLAKPTLELLPRADKRYDLIIRSTPEANPFEGWIGRLAPSLRALPYQSVNVDFINIGHRAMNFTSLWRWDANKRRIALNFSAPFRMNPGIVYRTRLDIRDESWNLRGTYSGAARTPTLRRYELGSDVAIALNDRLQWTLGAALVRRTFDNRDGTSFFQNSWSAELRNQLDYLLWHQPERRIRVNAFGLLRSGHIFSSDPSRLIVTEGGLSADWFPQAKGDVYLLTERILAGRVFGNVPLDELWMLGMERDNDLWLRGHVGTRDGQKGGAPMGQEFFLSQTDAKRKVFEIPFVRMDAGPFFDNGWTGDPSGRFGSRTWLYDAGAEARITTVNGIKFRFVYGRDLRNGGGVFYTAVSR